METTTTRYWWILETYGDRKFHLTPEQAEKLKVAKKMGFKDINIGDEENSPMIAMADIRLLEPTERLYRPDQPLIGEGYERPRLEAVYTDEGNVLVQWVKQYVPSRKWESYYAPSSGYFKLGTDGGNVVMAFRRPVFKGEVLPEDLCLCSIDETMKLEKWRKQ